MSRGQRVMITRWRSSSAGWRESVVDERSRMRSTGGGVTGSSRMHRGRNYRVPHTIADAAVVVVVIVVVAVTKFIEGRRRGRRRRRRRRGGRRWAGRSRRTAVRRSGTGRGERVLELRLERRQFRTGSLLLLVRRLDASLKELELRHEPVGRLTAAVGRRAARRRCDGHHPPQLQQSRRIAIVVRMVLGLPGTVLHPARTTGVGPILLGAVGRLRLTGRDGRRWRWGESQAQSDTDANAQSERSGGTDVNKTGRQPLAVEVPGWWSSIASTQVQQTSCPISNDE